MDHIGWHFGSRDRNNELVDASDPAVCRRDHDRYFRGGRCGEYNLAVRSSHPKLRNRKISDFNPLADARGYFADGMFADGVLYWTQFVVGWTNAM